jgi:hypothetical protein
MATPDPMAHLLMQRGSIAQCGVVRGGVGTVTNCRLSVHPPPSGRILSSSSSSGQDERPKETSWSGPPIGVDAPFRMLPRSQPVVSLRKRHWDPATKSETADDNRAPSRCAGWPIRTIGGRC